MLTQKGNALLLQVKVVPNASRTQLAGTLGTALKVKVAQPPEDGRANEAAIRFLAELLQVAPSQLALVAGHSRPQKTVQITGISLADALTRLTAAIGNRNN